MRQMYIQKIRIYEKILSFIRREYGNTSIEANDIFEELNDDRLNTLEALNDDRFNTLEALNRLPKE